jgi:hypothetical protein
MPRIVGEPAEDTTRYDAWIALPGASREAFEAFARETWCAPGCTFRPGNRSLKLSGPLMALAGLLERPLGQPVIDETRIDGAYEIKLTYADGSTDSLIQAVEKLGLRLTKARRSVEFLVVKKAQ